MREIYDTSKVEQDKDKKLKNKNKYCRQTELIANSFPGLKNLKNARQIRNFHLKQATKTIFFANAHFLGSLLLGYAIYKSHIHLNTAKTMLEAFLIYQSRKGYLVTFVGNSPVHPSNLENFFISQEILRLMEAENYINKKKAIKEANLLTEARQ